MNTVVSMFDDLVLRFVNSTHASLLDARMPMATEIFGPVFVGILSIGIISFYLYKKKIYSVPAYVFSLFGSLGTSIILKNLLERPRPLNGLVLETGYSFPSNHATTIVSACVFFGVIIIQSGINLWSKVVIVSILGVLVLFVGYSRVYLGVHYPSDVLGGYVIGAVFAYLGIRIAHHIECK